MSNEKLREEFEASFRKQNTAYLPQEVDEWLDRKPDNSYWQPWVQHQWQDYQAGVASQQEKPPVSTPQPQPIETAPKDGMIRLWDGERWVNGLWMTYTEGDDLGGWVAEIGSLRGAPTHWLPLTPPPGTNPNVQECPNCEEMRKALEFYANPANYLNDCPGERADEEGLSEDEAWVADCGYTARATLSTLKKQEGQS